MDTQKQMPSPQKKMIMFSHIPKTAGTSFNFLLRRYFGAKLISARPRAGTTYSLKDAEQDLKIFPRLRCITGHPIKPFVNFGKVASSMDWFTFLREPTSQFISLYIHQQTNGNNLYKHDLNEWAKKFPRSNYQVNWIAGTSDLEAAKQILVEKFKCVGFSENFSGSVFTFTREFNLCNFDTRLKKPRMMSRKDSLKHEILRNPSLYEETIRKGTDLDKELYQFAKENWKMALSHKQLKKTKSLSTPLELDNTNKSRKNRTKLISYQLNDKLIYKPYALITKIGRRN